MLRRSENMTKEKELVLERSSKDYYGKQNVTITINAERVEIPIAY